MENYLTLVVSCINSKIDNISSFERYVQTITALESYNQIPNNKIIMFDSSIDLEDHQIQELKNRTYYFENIKDPTSQKYTLTGHKSLGETFQIKYGLNFIKELNLPDISWVFKFGGRDILKNTFSVNEYMDNKNSFVFRKSCDSYIQGLKMIETTMWSFDYSILDDAVCLVDNVYDYLLNGGINTEHGYYLHLDKTKLVEKDIMHMVREYAPNNMVCEV
jgi:hypothetical protein